MTDMDICEAKDNEAKQWNAFVREHYPPIGAFMQTWEWGAFQGALGRSVARYFLLDADKPVATFMLVRHAIPGGFAYGYAPRGPVFADHITQENKTLELVRLLRAWALQNLPDLIFVRLEPPLSIVAPDLHDHGLYIPPYYVQPRYNSAVCLEQDQGKILEGFHPSTRSNIRRAENRGVTVQLRPEMNADDERHFFAMIRDTIQRNSGKNAYPDTPYFSALVTTLPPIPETHNPHELSLGIFYGYQHGEPAATHFVLFFGDTATYLYGASYTDRLSSKVTTYLHWQAMREAKRRGMRYYDLGGVDSARWPSLSDFKRQFRGREFSYIGNIDIPVRPLLYRAYNLVRKIKGLT